MTTRTSFRGQLFIALQLPNAQALGFAVQELGLESYISGTRCSGRVQASP